eukprot:10629611-Prorocentrum_lima.AAC.1
MLRWQSSAGRRPPRASASSPSSCKRSSERPAKSNGQGNDLKLYFANYTKYGKKAEQFLLGEAAAAYD